MATCAACDSYFLFGGVRDDHGRYCNDECQSRGAVLRVGAALPDKEVVEAAQAMKRAPCPQCEQRADSIDVYASYRALSFIITTRWATLSRISCKLCHVKAVAWNSLLTLLLGWWGFPWGLIASPVQLVRNLASLFIGGGVEPSGKLLDAARYEMALRNGQAGQATEESPSGQPASA